MVCGGRVILIAKYREQRGHPLVVSDSISSTIYRLKISGRLAHKIGLETKRS
jgi:hypothetical protein